MSGCMLVAFLAGTCMVRWANGEADDVLERAASLAAWYSSGRTSTTVEVDATQRRYVRKIKGAGPGMVTYRNERTLNVRPQSPAEWVGAKDIFPPAANKRGRGVVVRRASWTPRRKLLLGESGQKIPSS